MTRSAWLHHFQGHQTAGSTVFKAMFDLKILKKIMRVQWLNPLSRWRANRSNKWRKYGCVDRAATLKAPARSAQHFLMPHPKIDVISVQRSVTRYFIGIIASAQSRDSTGQFALDPRSLTPPRASRSTPSGSGGPRRSFSRRPRRSAWLGSQQLGPVFVDRRRVETNLPGDRHNGNSGFQQKLDPTPHLVSHHPGAPGLALWSSSRLINSDGHLLNTSSA